MLSYLQWNCCVIESLVKPTKFKAGSGHFFGWFWLFIFDLPLSFKERAFCSCFIWLLLLQMLTQHFRAAGFRLQGAPGGVVQHDHKGETRIGGKLRVLCHCWCRNIETSEHIQVWHKAQLVPWRDGRSRKPGMDCRRQGWGGTRRGRQHWHTELKELCHQNETPARNKMKWRGMELCGSGGRKTQADHAAGSEEGSFDGRRCWAQGWTSSVLPLPTTALCHDHFWGHFSCYRTEPVESPPSCSTEQLENIQQHIDFLSLRLWGVSGGYRNHQTFSLEPERDVGSTIVGEVDWPSRKNVMTEEAFLKWQTLLESISVSPTTWQQLPQDVESPLCSSKGDDEV